MQIAEASMSESMMALDNQTNRYKGDENLLVRFYTQADMNHAKTREEGRPIFEDVAFIQIMTPGNKENIIKRKASTIDINRFPEHYRKYKAREDQEAVSGTRLEEWPGITRSMCQELKYYNILTVEHLAEVSDGNSAQIMGFQALKTKAKAYLAASKDEATAEALTLANTRIDQLIARIEAMEAGNVDTVEDVPVKKVIKRRRRSKKQV